MASVEEHRKYPNIEVEDHVRSTQVKLGADLAHLRAVYLDLKFWILLRDATRGRAAPTATALLDAVRAAVSSRKIFCPISESVFLELMKQADPDWRMATVALIDELSLGVTLVDWDRRVATEAAHLMYSQGGVGDVYPLRQLVWISSF